jgi:trehalose synthase
MFDDRSRKYHNQYVPLKPILPEEYRPFVGKKFISQLQQVAEPLQKKVWANVNSTFVGGGVAEMLQSVVPFTRGLGIDSRWFVLEGNDEFFTVTKKFHNLLQGVRDSITLEEIFHAYLDNIRQDMQNVRVVADYVTIHDPQPAAIVMNGNVFGHLIWRCHIDTSQASRRVWRFLEPYINHCWGAIFTSREFVREPLQVPLYEISPSIDPLRRKNHEFSREQALGILSSLFHSHDIDSDRPLVLAVSRYDVHKNQKTIIRAFKKMKKSFSKKPPLLIIVGNSATDDPEGAHMFKEIQEEAGDDADIRLFVNVENNDEIIGALMALCNLFIHISTKEGFGLVVSEAMWHGAPVIGSRVGGIRQQVIHENTGYLVDPMDEEDICCRMKTLLESPDLQKEMGNRGQEHVRQHFILPRMIMKELILMRYYLEIDNKIPDFRFNDIAYREIALSLYGRKVYPFSVDEMRAKIESDIHRKTT